jgi:hypothetical protein
MKRGAVGLPRFWILDGSHGERLFSPWAFLCQTSIVFGFTTESSL